MNRTTHLFTRLVALATVGVATLFVTAGHAAARVVPLPEVPGPEGPGPVHGATPTPAGPIVHASISGLQWTLFAIALLGALVIGAGLMHVAQRPRGSVSTTAGRTSARYAA